MSSSQSLMKLMNSRDLWEQTFVESKTSFNVFFMVRNMHCAFIWLLLCLRFVDSRAFTNTLSETRLLKIHLHSKWMWFSSWSLYHFFDAIVFKLFVTELMFYDVHFIALIVFVLLLVWILINEVNLQNLQKFSWLNLYASQSVSYTYATF